MIRPLRDYVLVEIDREHVTPAGIVVQARHGQQVDSRAQYGHAGTVRAVGPGKRTRKGFTHHMYLQPGDRVRFGEFKFRQVDVDHVLIQEADVTCVESA